MKKRSWSTVILFLPAVVLILNDILLVALPSFFPTTISFLLLMLFPAFIVGIACVLASDKVQDKENVIGALVFSVFLWLWSFLFLMHFLMHFF